MGFLNKLLGRGDDDVATPTEFSPEAVRPAMSELIGALSALADAMDVEDAPLSNPGWRGRIRDLRNASGSLRVMARNPAFTRDDLFEVLTTVRPIYRGAPPKDFAHLAELNERVIAAIDGVYAAT